MQFDTRAWTRWLATFIGFPLAGLMARAVAGNIDDRTSALVGGAVAGAVLGAVQSLGLRPERHIGAWIAATTIGMMLGLSAGAAAVGYGTDATRLVLMGAMSGLGVGVAQAAVLRRTRARRILWGAATPAMWAAGWFITSQVIVDADRQHAVFGASGALVSTALLGLVLAVRPTELSRPSFATTSAVVS